MKVATQGFDLEVMRGAKTLLSHEKVHLVLLEITFDDTYLDAPSAAETLSYMRSMDFRLLSFYKMHFRNGFASWIDALFVNPNAKMLIRPE